MPARRTLTAPPSALLSIDLAALRANFKTLKRLSGKADCGVAIKGGAYGIGLVEAARALWQAGCRHFFVARPQEGAELRAVLPKALIYVLDGLYAGQAPYYTKHQLRPALVSADEIRDWAKQGKGQPCAIHVDTGINRAALPFNEFEKLAPKLQQMVNVQLLMSHLACSDEPDHTMNQQQLKRFQKVRAHLPDVPASLVNSGGIFLGPDYAFDLTRAGIAMYGANPTPHRANPMRVVTTLKVRVLQVKTIAKGEHVGYSATWTAPRDTKIAIIAAGYRDGIPRKLSSGKGKPDAQVWIGGRTCPIIGRVSMDMMGVDVTDAGRVRAGDYAEIFGPRISVDQTAASAETISYEVLTRLGNRYTRVIKT
jgi:alanine racemase